MAQTKQQQQQARFRWKPGDIVWVDGDGAKKESAPAAVKKPASPVPAKKRSQSH